MSRVHRLVVAGLVVCTGCASLTSGRQQTVQLRAVNDAARYTVRTVTGDSVTAGALPAALTLPRGERYLVEIAGASGDTTAVYLDRTLNAWLWGNLVMGGPLGLAVDFSNGAAYRLDPAQFVIPLERGPVAMAPLEAICYPAEAVATRAEGALRYRIFVGPDGRATRVAFTQSGHPVLRHVIVRWAAGQRFDDAAIARGWQDGSTLFLHRPRRPSDCPR